MSCGCGGSCCSNIMQGFPPIGGVIPMARTYMGGMAGLGDTTTCIAWDDNGNCTDTVTTPDSSSAATQVSSVPTETTYPVVVTSNTTSTPTPVNTTTTPATNTAATQLANAWTNIFGSILKAQTGANPTYQSTGPNGTSTTIYGSLPASLQSSLSQTSVGGLSVGTLLLLGAGVVVLMMVAKK